MVAHENPFAILAEDTIYRNDFNSDEFTMKVYKEIDDISAFEDDKKHEVHLEQDSEPATVAVQETIEKKIE